MSNKEMMAQFIAKALAESRPAKQSNIPYKQWERTVSIFEDKLRANSIRFNSAEFRNMVNA